MSRRTLPQRRAAETFELQHGQQIVTVTTGYYADGTLGEVFVSAPKAGSSMEGDCPRCRGLAVDRHPAPRPPRHPAARHHARAGRHGVEHHRQGRG